MGPDITGHGMNGHTLNIAISPSEQGIVNAWVIKPWIARCRVAINGNAVDASGIVFSVLSSVHITTITHRNIKVTEGIECHSTTEVPRSTGTRERFKDDVYVF